MAAQLIDHRAAAPIQNLTKSIEGAYNMHVAATSQAPAAINLRSDPKKYERQLRTYQESAQTHMDRAQQGSPFVSKEAWNGLKVAGTAIGLLVVVGAVSILTHGVATPFLLTMLASSGKSSSGSSKSEEQDHRYRH